MYSQDAVSALLGEIYDGATEPERWNSALQQFVNLSAARFAFLAIIDGSARTLPVSSIVGPQTSALGDALNLHRELIDLDPGLPYALGRPQGGNFRFSQTSADLTPEPETWRIFVHHELGSGDYHSRFSKEQDSVSLVLALHTPSDQPHLTREQEWLHALVFDHLQRASRLAYRPPNLRTSGRPVILVDGKGKILDASYCAEAVLSANDGLTVQQGHLRAADPASDQTMRVRIDSASRGNHDGRAETYCAIKRPSEHQSYFLKFGPVPLPVLGMHAPGHLCLIEILGARAQGPAMGDLGDLFGLTAREAEIAALFTEGFSDLRSIAEHLGISHETVRVHARSIFAKVGVANQVELVRVLAGLR